MTKLEKIRRALVDYIRSEGCSCCQNREKHEEAKTRLGELLDMPKYADSSGYDFYSSRNSANGEG